jgi:pimeloyl-ACP methyl ester carboxylesterase
VRTREVEVHRVHVDGVGLAVAESGAGGRPVLLVHGFTGAKEDFAGLMDPLAQRGWHAAAYDLRGHGSSDKPPGVESYDLPTFVADTLGVADELGWDRFTVLGHSMGGAIAQRLALDHPGRVDALVLMSTFHGPVEVNPNLVALGVAIVDQGGMEALAAALAARREADPAAVAARRRMEEVRPGHNEWADGKLLACSPDMWAAMAPRFLEWPDTLAAVAQIDVPTLVLVGEEDDTMRGQCQELAAAIPGARLDVIDGVRHSPQLEAPDRCWAALAAFLDGLV